MGARFSRLVALSVTPEVISSAAGVFVQDPAFKRIFASPITIKRLVRAHAREWAERIDFATLEPLPTEVVGPGLARRYPDMIWEASGPGGEGRVLILLEFQGRSDPLMVLRMAVYAAMVAVRALEKRREPTLILPFVIHHGSDRWRAPKLEALLPGWRAGWYALVTNGGLADGDVVGAILHLERNDSPEAMLRALAQLVAVAKETGSEYDALLAGAVGEMLVFTGQLTDAELEGAETMEQVQTTVRRGWEKWGREIRAKARREALEEGVRLGRDEGMQLGRAEVVLDLVRSRFGSEAAVSLEEALGTERLGAEAAAVAGAVLDAKTAADLLERVKAVGGDTAR